MSGVVVRCCWFRERKFEGSRKILAQAPLAQKGSQKGKPGGLEPQQGVGLGDWQWLAFFLPGPWSLGEARGRSSFRAEEMYLQPGREVQRRQQGPRHALCPGTGSCMS